VNKTFCVSALTQIFQKSFRAFTSLCPAVSAQLSTNVDAEGEIQPFKNITFSS